VKFLDFLFLYRLMSKENRLMTSARLLLSMKDKSIDMRKLFGVDEEDGYDWWGFDFLPSYEGGVV